MPVAYSYQRYSSRKQAKGDSIRRQTEAREYWLAAHKSVRLDATLTMTDAGRSAFKRKDWATYCLARFVEHIKTGRVGPGSYLLVENLDRLSREDAGEATELFLSIVNKGIVVVQLLPGVTEFRKPVDMQSLMYAVCELSRGHSESAMKSERAGKSWQNKRKHAAERVVTRKVPVWVRVNGDGKLTLDPAKAAVVKRLFALAREGFGSAAIAKRLNAEGVPVLGRKRIARQGQSHLDPDEREMVKIVWTEGVVHAILRSRTVIGEYQPHTARDGERKPCGDPIPNYYPVCISPDVYHAVQYALRGRGNGRYGHRGRYVDLFVGLLVDARDGGRP